MSDHLSEIERDSAAQRESLARSLDQLGRALSPHRITETVSREVTARGGAAGQVALDVARANPAAAALVGLGLAALAVGPKRPPRAKPYDTREAPTAKGLSDKDPLTGEFDARLAAAEEGPRAPAMRAALRKGLANLPEPARRRVIAAREAAIAAQEKLDRKAAAAARRARGFHHRQPLATGLLALGAGALAAALLPRTRLEDDAIGAQRDALLEQAELVLRDELAQARRTGEAALREGLEAGRDRLRRAH